MKKLFNLLCIIVFAVMFIANAGWSQCNPDSLELITVEGVVSADTSGKKVHYTMDVNGDAAADYVLNFGPYWYYPVEGVDLRPQDGDTVTIYGGANLTNPGAIPVLVVYEIEGLFWRNPYENFWNQINDLYKDDPFLLEDGSMPTWILDTVEIFDTTGVIYIDTTFKFLHYYLDVNYDSLMDYKLNFGPPWYLPPDSLSYPDAGDTVSIMGGVIHSNVYPILIVLSIDGEIWRDESLVGPNASAGGKWMKKNDNLASTVTCLFDTVSHLQFRQQWHRGNMPSSMFCQMLQVHFQNMPQFQNQEQKRFAGFEIGCFTEGGQNLMFQNQHRFAFNNQVRMQFHLNERQMERNGVRITDRLRLHYWNHEGNKWEEADAEIDLENRMINWESSELYTYFIITGDLGTTSIGSQARQGMGVHMYPNPCNDILYLEMSGEQDRQVRIMLLNNLGIVLRDYGLVYLDHSPRITLILDDLPSGLYYVMLQEKHDTNYSPFVIIR